MITLHRLAAFFALFILLQQTVSAHSEGDQVPVPTTASADTNLRILSWNIYMLPPIVARKGKRERARAIVQELRKDSFDVIVFQEAFLKAARRIIGTGLQDKFPYQYGPANLEAKGGTVTNSGVWVLSKIPMTQLNTIRFKDCATWDCYSRKGAMLLEGEWNGKKFQLLGTHLQADGYDAIRQRQMDQIYQELLTTYKKDSVPQIICGDMNTEHEMKEYYCSMLECLDAEDGTTDGVQKYSYDGQENDIALSQGGKGRTTLDYILLRNNGVKIRSVKRMINVLKKGKRQLSDHYGIICEVKF